MCTEIVIWKLENCNSILIQVKVGRMLHTSQDIFLRTQRPWTRKKQRIKRKPKKAQNEMEILCLRLTMESLRSNFVSFFCVCKISLGIMEQLIGGHARRKETTGKTKT
jgi:hypothetical protein